MKFIYLFICLSVSAPASAGYTPAMGHPVMGAPIYSNEFSSRLFLTYFAYALAIGAGLSFGKTFSEYSAIKLKNLKLKFFNYIKNISYEKIALKISYFIGKAIGYLIIACIYCIIIITVAYLYYKLIITLKYLIENI